MKLTRVGVDLAKNIFQLHGVDRAERPVWCRRLKRKRWIEEIEKKRGTRRRDRHGSLRRRASLGPSAAIKGLPSAVDSTAVREALSEEQQDRCQ